MNNAEAQLLDRIVSRRARLAVMGLGYVGLPLAVEFARAGFQTVGIDVDSRKVEAINAGRSYIGDVPQDELQAVVNVQRSPRTSHLEASNGEVRGSTSNVQGTTFNVERKLWATSDYGALADCDAVSICVPTPLSKTRDPDMSYVIAAADAVAKHIHAGMLIVLESTTYPGTTEEIVVPRMLTNGYAPGRDVFVAFSPERIDPGRTDRTLKNTPKVMGGVTSVCGALAACLYGCIVDEIVPVSSAAAAEMVKLLENTFRAVNIALVNEVLWMCDRLGLDAWEIIDAAATKPYGFMRFTPGPGVGGHCIPLDPQYLSWKLRTLNYHARFIQLASEINTGMPAYWVNRIAEALNESGRAVRGSRILVLGVTYKPDVADVRESPALDILQLLEARGADVAFHDPFLTSLRGEGLETPFADLTDKALAAADCVVILTDHSCYDWQRVVALATRIVDTRGVLRLPHRSPAPTPPRVPMADP